MRTPLGLVTLVAMAFGAEATASDLNIAVQTSSGVSSTSVSPGGTVNYRIVGTLGDLFNDGLALWAADLAMSGPAPVALQPAAVPTTEPMAHFVCPQGINNPPCASGYGGTVSGNNLLQVGGGQNTIRNTAANAPFPLAPDIMQNVAQSQVVLATGSVTMPSVGGVYTLAVSNVFASIVNDNTPANPTFYPTTATGIGTVGSLSITVSSTGLTTIASANPPRATDNPYQPGMPFVDPLTNRNSTNTVSQGIGASGTPGEGPVQYSAITVTFSGAPSPAPSTSNVTVACTGGSCPAVTSVTPVNATTFTVGLSGVIPALQCTTLTFAGTTAGEKLQYRAQPGNSNLDGFTNTQDLLFLVTGVSSGAANMPANLARYDIDRSGAVNTQDFLREVQLLNGVNTTQVFNGTVSAACP